MYEILYKYSNLLLKYQMTAFCIYILYIIFYYIIFLPTIHNLILMLFIVYDFVYVFHKKVLTHAIGHCEVIYVVFYFSYNPLLLQESNNFSEDKFFC